MQYHMNGEHGMSLQISKDAITAAVIAEGATASEDCNICHCSPKSLSKYNLYCKYSFILCPQTFPFEFGARNLSISVYERSK